MEKEEMKKGILRILALDIDDLPKKKRSLYSLLSLLFYTLQMMIITYMVFILSRERPYIGILALVYSVFLCVFYLKIYHRMKR